MIKEFKSFINRGNVVDLAVGVMIGGAFGKIITSIVDDLFMPLIGGLIGGVKFSSLSFSIGESIIKYGMLIQNIVNFILIAIFLFIVVKALNKMKPKKVEEEAKAIPAADVVLLTEIRDLLKKNKK